MPYESTITFTLDTICPWTYIAYRRLTRALSLLPPSSSSVTFTLVLSPYQLYPSAPDTGVSKSSFYLTERYAGSVERYAKYVSYMTALGCDEGIEFDFENGEVANTLHAHRVLWVLQERYGSQVAFRALESLYAAYFETGRHPSSEVTLMEACAAAGVGEDEARELVGGEEGKVETERKIREVSGDGVDSVPWVVLEGRKRDFTLVGAKEVGEYLKIMEQVAKEAS